jgi:hypothetical protein
MKKYLFLFLMAMPLLFMGCSSDDDEATLSKSELIGTWYTLEDDWVFAFTESTVTIYELWKSSGKYLLNPAYHVTRKYTISGNRVVSEDGHTATIISINDNTISVNIDNEMLTLTKFDGTPQQLLDYLNR